MANTLKMRTLEKLGPNMDQKIKKDPRGTQVPTGHTKNLEYPEFLTAPLKSVRLHSKSHRKSSKCQFFTMCQSFLLCGGNP